MRLMVLVMVLQAHVLPFARDRLGPLGAGEETVVLSRVVMGSAEVSYYREGPCRVCEGAVGAGK